jgi:hypothetical protein
MPVIIRNNDATELCITKGQEGHVAGWQASKGPQGQVVLDCHEHLLFPHTPPFRYVTIHALIT